MRFGITPPYRANVASDPEWMTTFVHAAEAAGFESVYAVEHIAVPAGFEEAYPYSETGRWPLPTDCELPDPLDLLAFLAARTERIVLSTGILIATMHHPLMLAKRLSTIDVLSAGRMRIGVGVGWMREEIEAIGVDFGTRGRRLDEVLAAMQALWTEDEATFAGEFSSFDRVVSRPRPTQPHGVPIHVGGHSPAAARRAGRFGAGFQPIGVAPDVLPERLDQMRRATDDAGRDGAAIDFTLGGGLAAFDEGVLGRLAAQGADRILLSATSADLGEVTDQMAAIAAFVDA